MDASPPGGYAVATAVETVAIVFSYFDISAQIEDVLFHQHSHNQHDPQQALGVHSPKPPSAVAAGRAALQWR